MKKLSILLAILALIFTLPVTALAAEGEPSPSPSATPQESQEADTPEESVAPAVSLSIDNSNVYDGMDRAYKDGYTPAVKDGVATVILPLISSGEIKDHTIIATPGLGDATTAPFVYKNYQKTVSLQDNPITGGRTVSSYLVRFDLPLASGRYNGIYPVTIDVQAQAADDSPIQQSFTTYVTITDGKDPNAAQPTPEPETPKSQPKVIVSSYSINPSPAMAGEEFAASVTLKNTSEKQSVQNMTVTVSCDCPNLTLQNDTSTIYIGKLSKGKTTDIELSYKADLATPAGQYNITLAIDYENSDAAALSSAGTVPITIDQPLRVEMETPQIPTEVNAGDTMPLSFQVMNMGRSAVYNVRIELSAPGLIPTGTAFIGNMEAGTAMPGEMDVFIGTKNMSEGYEGDDKYGNTNGTITLIYEDADGQEYTNETEFSTTINEPVITASNNEVEEEPEKASQWWISIVIGIVVIAGLAAYVVIWKRRREKNNADF
jgi:hypothetical protein